MIQVKRLGHATFTTTDMEKQLDYWTQVIGLCVVARDKDRVVLATKLGQECVVLERGAEAGARVGRLEEAALAALQRHAVLEAGVRQGPLREELAADRLPEPPVRGVVGEGEAAEEREEHRGFRGASAV